MNIAVIGCGYWGKNLVRNFNQLEALSLVCDTTAVGRATAAELAPQARIVADLDEVLARRERQSGEGKRRDGGIDASGFP